MRRDHQEIVERVARLEEGNTKLKKTAGILKNILNALDENEEQIKDLLKKSKFINRKWGE